MCTELTNAPLGVPTPTENKNLCIKKTSLIFHYISERFFDFKLQLR